MAFHKTNLGKFGENLPCDLQGYVPEEGDHYDDFHWEEGFSWDKKSWENFVAKAVSQTNQALAELDMVNGVKPNPGTYHEVVYDDYYGLYCSTCGETQPYPGKVVSCPALANR